MGLGLNIDETLLEALIAGVRQGLEMTGVEPDPVGATRFFTATRDISVIVSLLGRQNGTLTLSFSRKAAAFLAGKLLDENATELTDDSIDGICEIGNIVAGSIKTILRDTSFKIDAISCPALIMGANYNLYHYRGVITVSVEFEIRELPMVDLKDRFFTASLCLIKV